MFQSGRAGDEAKKRKSPIKSGRVGIIANASRATSRVAQESVKGQLTSTSHDISLRD